MSVVADLLLKPTALLLGAVLLSAMLRNRSASVRHAIWMLALTAAFVGPTMPYIVPAFTVQWFAGSTDAGPAFTAPRPALDGAAVNEGMRGDASQVLAIDVVSAFTPTRLAVLLWLMGAIVVSGRTVLGLRSARRLLRRARHPVEPQWLALLSELEGVMRMRTAVRLCVGDDVVPPLTCGVWRPTVLLPAVARQWSAEAVRITLAHELAHVKRRDVLQHLLVQACCAMHWFNPLVWYAAHRVRIEREHACDDSVLALGTSAAEYGAHLISLARGARGVSPGSVAIVLRSDLETRLRAILDPQLRRHPLSRGSIAMLCAAALSVTLVIGSVQLRAQPAGQPDPAATTRAAAACEMGQGGDLSVIPALVNLLGDDTPSAPMQCAAEGGWNPALRSLKHPSPGEQAAISLASLSQPAMEALLGALASGDATVRRNAAWAIGELRFARGIRVDRDLAVDPLVGALSDSDDWVRTAAAFSLGELKAPVAIDALIVSLGDADAKARMMAARALGEMKAGRAVDALRMTLTDADERVRSTARWALAEIP